MKKNLILLGCLILLTIITLFIVLYKHKISVSDINQNLLIDGIYYGMSEEELIKVWGKGEFQEGFGGHFRDYKDKMISLGISGDTDNDLYNKISNISFKNPKFSLYGIHIGDSTNEGVALLKKHGFQYDGELFIKGEFVVALRSEEKISQIQLWFNYKDLQDRQY